MDLGVTGPREARASRMAAQAPMDAAKAKSHAGAVQVATDAKAKAEAEAAPSSDAQSNATREQNATRIFRLRQRQEICRRRHVPLTGSPAGGGGADRGGSTGYAAQVRMKPPCQTNIARPESAPRF